MDAYGSERKSILSSLELLSEDSSSQREDEIGGQDGGSFANECAIFRVSDRHHVCN
jgi:hypothetical protein